jgi:hypothetical protein
LTNHMVDAVVVQHGDAAHTIETRLARLSK